jgi:hypothetical protein
MTIVNNEGYGKLQKNNTPAKPTVMVTLMAFGMVTAMVTAIAFNSIGVFPKNSPYIDQAHQKDVPSFPVWCLNCHKKKPNVRPVLIPKGHAKAAF